MTTNFFSPLSFVAVFGSGIGMGKNQDPGSATLPAIHKKTEKERQLADERGVEEEPDQVTARKPGPL